MDTDWTGMYVTAAGYNRATLCKSPTSVTTNNRSPSLSRPLTALIVFTVSFAAFSLLTTRMPSLWETDSYYHLAVARLYAEEGITARPPWARFSLISEGGDKEYLFHLMLIPFVETMNPETGGRIALAAIDAALFTVLTSVSVGMIGWPGYLVPIWIFVAVAPFTSRLMRIRPELVALVIILFAVTRFPMRRDRFIALLAFFFALTYTAVHVFVALSVMWLLCDCVILRQRPRVVSFLYPLIGCVAGVVCHPHLGSYLRIWYAQNVLYFFHKRQLDVGAEIFAPDVRFLVTCLPWLVTIAVLLLIGWERRTINRQMLNLACTAAVFVILFIPMARMITYVIPLVTLTAVSLLQQSMTMRRAFSVAAVLVISIGIGLFTFFQSGYIPRWIFSPRFTPGVAWERTGEMLRPGARVATTWGNADLFSYFAPRARFLNVLDPIFMYARDPERSTAWLRVMRGVEPDVPGVVASTLQSDYLLIDPTRASPVLLKRMEHDPRLIPLASGLFMLQPATGYFVTDWKTSDGNAFGSSAFVALRANDAKCLILTHEEPAHEQSSSWEFAPYGQSVMSIDGRKLVAARGTSGAILGHGFRFELPASPHLRHVEIQTCRAEDGTGGFYLLRR